MPFAIVFTPRFLRIVEPDPRVTSLPIVLVRLCSSDTIDIHLDLDFLDLVSIIILTLDQFRKSTFTRRCHGVSCRIATA